jgi:competence protein ComFB
MTFQERYDFEALVNEAERLVVEELERQLEEPEYAGICKCQDCIVDMATFALNTVKPLYRATLLGRIYARSMDQTDYEESVRKAVRTAIDKISKNPSHD